MDAELTKTFVYDPGCPVVVQEGPIRDKDVAKSEDKAKREDIAKHGDKANNGDIVKDESERHAIYSVGVSCTCFSKGWKACVAT